MTDEQAEGTVAPDDPAYVDPELEQKSVEEVAKEVLAGYWSRGNSRNQRLKDAGYDPEAVEAEVTKILNQ